MITEFRGDHSYLSNFYELSKPIWWHGYKAHTVEHMFQAAKTVRKRDKLNILDARTPADAKRRGRAVPMRPHWDDLRVGVMYELVYKKFKANTDLLAKLRATAPEPLIEGNWWHDNFWGECRCGNCIGERSTNWLGRILEQVREEL